MVWWSKLGVARPISVRLRSLVGGGGATPLLRVLVARVYPLLYCVRTGSRTEYIR